MLSQLSIFKKIVLASVLTFNASAAIAADPELVTDLNRNSDSMMGGWGDHLRSIFTMADGYQWYAADGGADVNNNTTLNYFRHEAAGWRLVGTTAISAGVQQNMAVVANSTTLYSYGVDIINRRLIECRFNSATFVASTCTRVSVLGLPISIAANSNYVGAAIRPDGSRIVWWTTVGVNGGVGTFSYTYTRNNAWQRPVNTGLGTYNYVAYIRARLDGSQRLRLIGEMGQGAYPNTTYYAGLARLEVGKTVGWTAITGAKSANDVWHDTASGATHVLAGLTTGGIGYYFLPGTQWPVSGQPVSTFATGYRMRFAKMDTDLSLIQDNVPLDQILVYRAPLNAAIAPIDWAAQPVQQLVRPVGTLNRWLTGLYIADNSKQTTPPTTSKFAVCGAYSDQDHTVWSYNPAVP